MGALFFGLGLVQACATDVVIPGVEDDDSGTLQPVDATVDRAAPTPPKDAGRDTSTPPADSGRDSAVADATVDASDAGGDRPGDPFDPLAPKTGDMCPAGVAVNDTIQRRCGKCGSQAALCEAGRIVGTYGVCSGESTAPEACLPGAQTSQACGLCGRQNVRCGTTCALEPGACQNEVPGGCVAGSVKYLATCANPAEFRRQVCSATCVPGTAEPCAPRAPDTTVAISQTVAGVVRQTLTTDSAAKLPALATPFCNTTVSATISSIYNYVLVTNSGAQAANVTIRNTGLTDAALAAYPGGFLPGDRLACLDHVGINKFTLEIPAGGSRVVYVGGLSASATGSFPLEITTNFLGAEVPGAADYTLAISQTMGGIATQPITFDEDKFAPATVGLNAPTDYTGQNPCPVVKMGAELPQRFVQLTNSGASARTVNLTMTSLDDDSYLAVYPSVPAFNARRACTGNYNDDCVSSMTDFYACLNAVTVPANGSVVVYVGQDTFDGLYDTNTLRVTTTN